MTAGADGMIYALGGRNAFGGPSSIAHRYKPVLNQWQSLPDMALSGLGHAAASSPDGRVYSLGGFCNCIQHYVPALNRGSAARRCSRPDDGLGRRASDGRIYAVGGEYGTSASAVVEAYDPGTNDWEAAPALNIARRYPAVVADRQGTLYAIGGQDEDENALASVERYRPGDTGWTFVASLTTARYWISGSLGPDGRIYAAGGIDGSNVNVTNAEAYNPLSDKWSTVASHPAGIYGIGAGLAGNDKIYMLGSNDSNAMVTLAYEAPLDADGDGCAYERENSDDPDGGGSRSPLDFWDFFDVTGDRSIDVGDALDVLRRR